MFMVLDEVSVATNDFDAVTLDQKVKFFYTYHHVREQSGLFGFSDLAAKKVGPIQSRFQGLAAALAMRKRAMPVGA